MTLLVMMSMNLLAVAMMVTMKTVNKVTRVTAVAMKMKVAEGVLHYSGRGEGRGSGREKGRGGGVWGK